MAHGGGTALVMTGGGARAAYQVGFLRWLARNVPNLSFEVLCGVSAGAINAAFLAARTEPLVERIGYLSQLWNDLRTEHVFKAKGPGLMRTGMRWAVRLGAGGRGPRTKTRGLVDTEPLGDFLRDVLRATPDGHLPGIDANLDRTSLRALAITTSSYTTGQSVTWVQGRDLELWERPNRIARKARLRVRHVMASAALPFVFPAVSIARSWYGDGGIRLAAPLSPAIHLGAKRIIAVTTRYDRSRREASEPSIDHYPPPAQVAGVLLNAIFLDLIDQDALRLERFNELLEATPSESHGPMRKVDLLVLRPTTDLGALANHHEADLPRSFRFMTRGWGTRETRSNDVLSMVMFQPTYLQQLMELGERDAAARRDEILAFMGDGTA